MWYPFSIPIFQKFLSLEAQANVCQCSQHCYVTWKNKRFLDLLHRFLRWKHEPIWIEAPLFEVLALSKSKEYVLLNIRYHPYLYPWFHESAALLFLIFEKQLTTHFMPIHKNQHQETNEETQILIRA